jgi:hypothetical protein
VVVGARLWRSPAAAIIDPGERCKIIPAQLKNHVLRLVLEHTVALRIHGVREAKYLATASAREWTCIFS